MPPLDSLVRLKQLYTPDISGYVVTILQQYLTTGNLTGFATNTGQLVNVFYPLTTNPSGYLIPSQTGYLVSQTQLNNTQLSILATVGATYYPNSNPSGFITGISGLSNQFYPLNSNPKQYASYTLATGQSYYNGYNGKVLDGYAVNTDVLATNFIYYSGDFNDLSSAVFDLSQQQILSRFDNSISIDWGNRNLNDANSAISVDWQNKKLISGSVVLTNNVTTLDWGNRILYGNWTIQAANFPTGFTISGIPVITGNQTGLFYPLSNPSGFVTFKQLTGASGALNDSINRLSSTVSGNFYPLSNPNGFVTTTGQTVRYTGFFMHLSGVTLSFDSAATFNQGTNFGGTMGLTYLLPYAPDILAVQAGGTLTTATQAGITKYITTGQTGIFITTGQTGKFYPSSNPSGFITLTYANNTYVQTNLSNIVTTTGTQTISGQKTFNSGVIMNNTLYVDNIRANSSHVKIYDIPANLSADFTQRILTDSGQLNSVNWQNRQLVGVDGSTVAADWNTQTLYNIWAIDGISGASDNYVGMIGSDGNVSVDWMNKQLSTSNGPIVDWNACMLHDNHVISTNSLNWQSRYLLDSNEGHISLDWDNKQLMEADGSTVALDWGKKTLNGTWSGTQISLYDIFTPNSFNAVIDVSDQTLFDAGGAQSVDWTNRLLGTGSVNDFTLDWGHRLLIGTWNASGLQVSGNKVLTTLDSGAFYPIYNPAKYISTTGNNVYVTGANVIISGASSTKVESTVTFDYGVTLNSQVVYPYVPNTGWNDALGVGSFGQIDTLGRLGITKYVTTGQTGAFYPATSNPAQYISNIDPQNQFRVVSGQFRIWDIGYYGWMAVNFATGQLITSGPYYDYVSYITPNADYRFISGQMQLWDNIFNSWVAPISNSGSLSCSANVPDRGETNANLVTNIVSGYDCRFISGQFQLWDIGYSGWVPVSSFSGQLYCGAYVPDGGQTDANFLRMMSPANNYRFVDSQFQIWDVGYNGWIAMIVSSGILCASNLMV